MRVRIIANPVSGGGRGARLAERLQHALDGRVHHTELRLTRRPEDCAQLAAAPGADCIVAVGGDGTINQILNGMHDPEVALGILPTGTANVVARELRIPKQPERVADLIAAGHTRPMDAGLAGNRRFLLGAGAGLDAAVTQAVSERRGGRSSYLRWIIPSVRTVLDYPYPRIRATVDGTEISREAQYAIVGNCRYSAGLFPATPNAEIDDGLLDLVLLRNLSALRLAHLALTVWNPRYLDHPDVTAVQGKEIRLEPAESGTIPLQIDGDPAGSLPATVTIQPRAIKIISPAQPQS